MRSGGELSSKENHVRGHRSAEVFPSSFIHRICLRNAARGEPALCSEDGVYQVGDSLTAKWRISRVPLDEIHSFGSIGAVVHRRQGDEDLHVHHFHRLADDQLRRVGLADEQSTHCALPATPLSYQGHLISLRWGVRVRIFLADGREIVAEQPFHLVSHEFVSPERAKRESHCVKSVLYPFRPSGCDSVSIS